MVERFLNRTRKQDGFTLIELIVVVAILGILAAVVTPRVLDAVDNARKNSALAFGKEVQLAMERYYLENGDYPAEEGFDTYPEIVSVLKDYLTIEESQFQTGNPSYMYIAAGTSGETPSYDLILYLEESKAKVTIKPGSVEVE